MRALTVLVGFFVSTLAAASPRLLVAGSDYVTGRLDVVPLAGGVVERVMPIHSDAITRAPEGSPFSFVVNRAGMDSIRVLDRQTNRIINEVPVGRGSNPQDIVPIARDRAYVSRHSAGDLLLIDPTRTVSAEVGKIALGGYAAEKGVPQMAAMFLAGNQLLVALQRLKRGFVPSNYSLVAVVDTRNQAVTKTVKLERATNPVTDFKVGPGGGIYLGCAGHIGVTSELDGAIERLDPRTFALGARPVVTEKMLGGDIVDFEILDSDRGVAVISAPDTRLVTFDVRTGRLTGVLISSAGYHLQQVLADRDGGKLYVADRDPHRPAVRVFDLATLREESARQMTLPPYQMSLLR